MKRDTAPAVDSYGAPVAATYGAPAPTDSYGAPVAAPSYSAPAPSYDAPAPSYDAPSYAAPASGYSAAASGKDRLDGQVNYLLNDLPGKIETAVAAIEAGIGKSLTKSITQGWSIVFASWKEIYGIYKTEEKTLSTLTPADLYTYGFLGTYGVGFGFPLLLGLPERQLSCGAYDFTSLVDRYGLAGGVAGYYPSHDHALGASLDSRVAEFDLLVRAKLDCVLSQENDYLEAAEVAWALDELSAALSARIACEEQPEAVYGK